MINGPPPENLVKPKPPPLPPSCFYPEANDTPSASSRDADDDMTWLWWLALLLL